MFDTPSTVSFSSSESSPPPPPPSPPPPPPPPPPSAPSPPPPPPTRTSPSTSIMSASATSPHALPPSPGLSRTTLAAVGVGAGLDGDEEELRRSKRKAENVLSIGVRRVLQLLVWLPSSRVVVAAQATKISLEWPSNCCPARVVVWFRGVGQVYGWCGGWTLRNPNRIRAVHLEEDIKALFPPDSSPFYAGFGNRDTDEISYFKVGIPKGKFFIINPKEDFNSWNFWRLLPLGL
ncbi:hypothetical protein Droror1_Dr00002450 [Drosera rotundifolia]